MTGLMWLAWVVTPLVGVIAYWVDTQADARARCEQRIEAREGSRARAFTNIDYVASIVDSIDAFVGIPADLRADLDRREQRERELVDLQLPPITLDNCSVTITPTPEES